MLQRILLPTVLAAAVLAAPALAQRGTGQEGGVGVSGEFDSRGITGTINEVVVGECAASTGRAIEGAHLIVTTLGN